MKLENLVLIFLITTLYCQSFYNASEFIELIRANTPADEDKLIDGINNTLEFLKHYIFYNISSNPPQPEFNESYFPKKDFLKIFKSIKTKNTNLFDFKNEFISAVYELNDLHTMPLFQMFPLNYFGFICPINLTTKYDNETKEAKMYGTFAVNKDAYVLFKDYEHVVNVIEKNLNNSIESINGKSPFSFIQDFAGIKIRNKHSTYVYNQMMYTYNNFYIPATEKELTNFTVKYSSGDIFTTDYIIISYLNLTNDNSDIKFYDNEEDNKFFLKYLSNYNNNIQTSFFKNELFPNFHLKRFDEIMLDFESMNGIKSNNIFLPPKKESKNEIEWDLYYKSLDNNYTCFQCRVDKQNRVNVIRINTFGGVSDSDPSLDVAQQCAFLFDENDYRIVIIFPRNGGGNPIIGYNIIELLSPYILTRNTVRMKKDEGMGQLIDDYNKANLFVELNSTKKVSADYIKDEFVKEIYGDKTEEFSKPYSWRVNQARIEQIKKQLKHKRTPTDIVIMTDGFALSSASIFMKNAYKSGAGIIVGYNGNPEISDDLYDISQSPSPVCGINYYKNIFPEIYNKTITYLFGLASITCMASYHEFQESHTPLEYEVQNPDVRIKIFHPYDDEYYQDFINEAINVLDSYKDKCNPKHQMLVSFSNDCKFDNKLLHGGYGCGSDSTWNKSNCIPVYCDTGYYYNKISNSCIKYPMDENDEKDDKTLMVILIVVSVCVVVSLILILIILYKKELLCFKKKEITHDPNYNINEDLMPENE